MAAADGIFGLKEEQTTAFQAFVDKKQVCHQDLVTLTRQLRYVTCFIVLIGLPTCTQRASSPWKPRGSRVIWIFKLHASKFDPALIIQMYNCVVPRLCRRFPKLFENQIRVKPFHPFSVTIYSYLGGQRG